MIKDDKKKVELEKTEEAFRLAMERVKVGLAKRVQRSA